MRKKLSPIVTVLICLFSGNLVYGLEQTQVYSVGIGSTPSIAVANTGSLYIVYEKPVTYEVAKAIRDENGHVHAVEGATLTLPGISFSQSDNGEKWSQPKRLPELGGASRQPQIAVEKNGAIDLVWTGSDAADAVNDIYFSRSTDSGDTWTKPINVANTPGDSNQPAIVVAPDDSIHVIWCDTSRGENHKDIYYSYSKDGGKMWGKSPLLPAENVSNTPGESCQPAISISKTGTIYIAWLDNTPGETHPDIYYAYKADASWSQPIDVSNSPRASSHPGIACGDNGKVYLSWGDNSRKELAADIWCAIASEKESFDRPINISSTPGVSSEPVIAAGESGYAAIAWSDTSNSPNKPDIYCRVSSKHDSGFSRVIDLSHTTQVAKHPDVIIAGEKMFVTWEEGDGASKQIKIASLELNDIPTGPVLNVTPNIKLHK